MNLQQFEQAVLKLAFETDARITTASVAYYLGVPSRKANELLNELLEEGVLELDSDPDGNLYYRVPHKSADEATISEFKQLENQVRAEAATGNAEKPTAEEAAPKEPEASTVRVSEKYLASADSGDEGEAFAPSASASPAFSRKPRTSGEPSGGPRLVAAADGVTSGPKIREKTPHQRVQKEHPSRDNWGGLDDYYARPAGLDGSSGEAVRQTKKKKKKKKSPQAVWTGVATRMSDPDASLDRCGSSSMVVSTEVRCEPRPLPSSRPEIVTCSDGAQQTELVAEENQRTEHLWFGSRSTDQTALVQTGGETALARDYYIEQPEHQPGMALLLSLILCGTGQIYNGEVSKGIMMMVLCFLLWFVLLGWVVHIWSIVDAVVVAERLNRKHA